MKAFSVGFERFDAVEAMLHQCDGRQPAVPKASADVGDREERRVRSSGWSSSTVDLCGAARRAAEHGRRSAERAVECGGEVTVAREPEVERKLRQVIGVRQLDERAGEAGRQRVLV
jgi:hypothetical protein